MHDRNKKKPKAAVNPPQRGKNPRAVQQPTVTKTPSLGPQRHPEDHLRFSFSELDHDGSWPLSKVSPSDLNRLLRKLQSLENYTVDQAKQTHTLSELSMGDCPNKSAATRLANQYEGLDVLHELRVQKSQAGRIFGRLEGRFFNIFWWDPNHEVWPEGKTRR